jgi:hypothetical protein
VAGRSLVNERASLKFKKALKGFFKFERATGFAPVPKPWKGFVLLLHYARKNFHQKIFP